MAGTNSGNPAIEQAQQLINSSQFDKAEALLTEVIHGGRANAKMHYQLGVAKALSGRQHQAVGDFRQAVALDPAFSEGYNGLALALYELGELVAANEVCEQAFTLSHPCLKLYSTWAKILQRMNRLEKAKDILEKALQLQPNNPFVWRNLAAVAGEMNDKALAITCFERALKLAPAMVDVHGSIAEHRDYPVTDDSHLVTMHSALKQSGHPRVQAGVAFGLARAYEKLADYLQSAKFYRIANSKLQALSPYDQHKTESQFAAIKSFYNQEKIEQLSSHGSGDDTPIFIVGMPRSGTSLVEQILASHNQVFGAGELNYIKTLLLRGVITRPMILSVPSLMLTNINLKALPAAI